MAGRDARTDLRTHWRGKAKPRYRSPYDDPRPRYDGPQWIGEAITAPPVTAGPGWIGQRIRFRRMARGNGDVLPQGDKIGT